MMGLHDWFYKTCGFAVLNIWIFSPCPLPVVSFWWTVGHFKSRYQDLADSDILLVFLPELLSSKQTEIFQYHWRLDYCCPHRNINQSAGTHVIWNFLKLFILNEKQTGEVNLNYILLSSFFIRISIYIESMVKVID